MLLPRETPKPCRRILVLAERNPGRMIPIARRAMLMTPQDDLNSRAWSIYTLAWVLLRAEHIVEANDYFREIEQLASTHDLGNLALHTRRAILIAEMQVFGGSQEEWQALALEYEHTGQPDEAARTRIQQAAHLNMLSHPEEALELLNGIRTYVDESGTPDDNARLLRIMGVAYARLGKLDRAQNCLDRATQLFMQLHSSLETAKCWFELANNAHSREDYGATQHFLDQALSVFEHLGLALQVAFCRKSYGILMSRLGRYDDAFAVTLQAREQFIACNRVDQGAACDHNLGVIAHYIGLYELARAAYRRAYDHYARLGLQHYALGCRRDEALALRAQGQPQAALKLLQFLTGIAVELSDQLEAAELVFIQAQAQRALQNYPAAFDDLAQARTQFVALNKPASVAKCDSELGWLYLDQNNLVKAEEIFTAISTTLDDRPNHMWRIQYGLACCIRQRDQQAALSYYRAASTTIAALRRRLASEHASSGIFVEAQRMLAEAIKLAADLEDIPSLLALNEEQRALTLRRQSTSLSLAIPPDLSSEYERQHNRLRRLLEHETTGDDLDQALAAYMEVVLHIRHRAVLPNEPGEAFDLAALRRQLCHTFPEDWLVLVVIALDDELLTVTLDQQTAALNRIPVTTRLRKLIAEATKPDYRNMTYIDLKWHGKKTAEPWQTIRDLSDILLPAAVRSRLHPDQRLLIVPDGALHALPWAALRVDESWLCQRAIVQLLPGLTHWMMLANRASNATDAVLIGCSQFGNRARDLQHVAAELALVASHWNGPTIRLVDDSATRGAVLNLAAAGALRRCRLLHLTTHTQLADQRGLLAHIKLWDDDIFQDEVAGLTLGGSIVVVTGCESALGEVLPGDEVVSLSRAFLAAGARDVIAGLWLIYDAASQPLLAALYQSLALGRDPATALAHAQRACITHDDESIRVPYIWAPLHHYGAGLSSML